MVKVHDHAFNFWTINLKPTINLSPSHENTIKRLKAAALNYSGVNSVAGDQLVDTLS